MNLLPASPAGRLQMILGLGRGLPRYDPDTGEYLGHDGAGIISNEMAAALIRGSDPPAAPTTPPPEVPPTDPAPAPLLEPDDLEETQPDPEPERPG